MGLLSAFKRSSSRDSSQHGQRPQGSTRPTSPDENADPTPLRPLKLSLTPAKPRLSRDISDGLQGRDASVTAEGSLRQRHGAPSSPSKSPSKGIAKAFRQARSRFETLSEGGALSRPGSAAPSAAASPQQPPRTPVAARHQAQPSHEAYSPLLIGPPAAHNIQWTLHQSPARGTPPLLPSEKGNLQRLRRSLHKMELGGSPADAPPGRHRACAQLPAVPGPPSVTPSRASSFSMPALLSSGDDNLKVMVRIRPLNARELETGGQKCISQSNDRSLRVLTSEPQHYTFDAVAGEDADQDVIFQVAGRPIVENCLAGYNSCIFAYGHTGSGKTFTMLGPQADGGQHCQMRGLTPRVFESLFQRIAELDKEAGAGQRTVKCKCSFLEIYNETLTDLLSPAEGQHLQIREDASHGIYVENLCEEAASGMEDVAGLLARGQAARRVGETKMNRESSRSHSVFTCTLERTSTDASGITQILRSRLNLVDLAGSERQKASGAANERLREASSINKSLSTLGHVIMSLADVQRGAQRHVPYRDSRLTYLLQESLGGNSKTIMVANIGPSSSNLAETLSTLRFAQRAKSIKNKAVVNEDTLGDVSSLQAEIARLKDELASARTLSMEPGQSRQLTAAQLAATPLRDFGPDQGFPTPQAGRLPGAAGHAALVGALRREEAASRSIKRLERDVEALQDLLKQRDMDAQRTKMIIRLKEDKIARLQGASGPLRGTTAEADAELEALRNERALLIDKLNNHPDVRKYAAENMRLSEQVAALKEDAVADEAEALRDDVALLRAETIRLADENKRLQSAPRVKEVEAAAERAAAQSAAVIEEAMAQAEEARRRAEQDTQSRAMEIVSLKDRLAEAEEGRVEVRQKLGETFADVHRLEALVMRLEQDVDSARLEASERRAEAQGLMGVAERNAQLAADLAAARERGLQAQERAAGLEAALRERDSAAEAEQLLRCRSEQTMAEQEARLQQAQEQLQELHALEAQLQRALEASTAESVATIAVLKATMESASTEALELEQRRQKEEVATLIEELEEQRRMALDAQRGADAADAQLAQARHQQAAAEQQAAELEERLSDALCDREDSSRAHLELRAALRDVLEEMAAQEAAVQADLAHKAGVITVQQEQICALDDALQGRVKVVMQEPEDEMQEKQSPSRSPLAERNI
ncbi:hypothetical protein CVIRNUC_000798 [Coccomyxa viridis]|uniref:Kinesin motor domain-containing protein n=1 Tax=Coccomyxa viridis TaxID=1274662 RepID=A0AAV1HRA0_9CHLO|nr:hypothetical protein CVIRNUC_000798 [Coccomyxa viridis]